MVLKSLKYTMCSWHTNIIKQIDEVNNDGSINNMIGVSSTNPYQPPESPDFIINTEKENIQQSVENLLRFSMKHLSVNHANQEIKETKIYHGIC